MFKILGYELANIGYYINLETSKDRKENVEKQIKNYKIEGLNRFNALTDSWIHYSCTKSHLNLMKTAIDNGYDKVFIAEDDFQINDKCYYPIKNNSDSFIDLDIVMQSVYDDIKNEDWDVLLLGCNPKTHIIPITNNLGVVNKSTGAWAYIINKRAMKYIVENLNYKKDLLAIDDFLPLLNKKGFKVVTTIPMVIGHANGFVSTLQPRGAVFYDLWINGNYNQFLYDNLNNRIDISKIQNNITILITGHFCENFLFYLNYLLYSLPNELNTCKFIIRYDNSSNNHQDVIKLNNFFKNKYSHLNVDVTTVFGGLMSTIKNGLDIIETPYFIHLEHDWVFLKKDLVNFEKLITAINKHDFLHAVWFNKDDNQLRGFEIAADVNGNVTPYKKEERVNDIDLITTVRWSNNPAIYRRSKYLEWFNKYIINDILGIQNQQQYNVEEKMIPTYRKIISENKFEDIKDEWGTYIYGKIGDDAIVAHTDASRRYLKGMRSQPEINGDEYIKNNPLKL